MELQWSTWIKVTRPLFEVDGQNLKLKMSPLCLIRFKDALCLKELHFIPLHSIVDILAHPVPAPDGGHGAALQHMLETTPCAPNKRWFSVATSSLVKSLTSYSGELQAPGVPKIKSVLTVFSPMPSSPQLLPPLHHHLISLPFSPSNVNSYERLPHLRMKLKV